jgi:hypothetical protein
MPKPISSKHFAINRKTFGGLTTVDFTPNIPSKTRVKPEIAEHYIDDETGDTWLILKNGNKISQLSYEAMWGKLKKVV